MSKYVIDARRARFLNDDHDYLGPQYFDQQEIHVTAASQKEALKKAAAEYGSEEIVKNGSYQEDENGVWTEMDIRKVEI